MSNNEQIDQNPEAVNKTEQEENSKKENTLENQETPTSIEKDVEVVENKVEPTAEKPKEEELTPGALPKVDDTVAAAEPIVSEAKEAIKEEIPVESVVETQQPLEIEVEKEKTTDKKEDIQETSDPKLVVDEVIVADDLHDEHEEDSHDEDDTNEEEEIEQIINYDEQSTEELVVMLEELVQNDEVQAIRKKVALIKVAFLKKHKVIEEERLASQVSEDEKNDQGEVVPVQDELQNRFNDAFRVYSEKRKRFLEDQEKEKLTNLEAKKIILEELKTLIESEESLKKTYDDFKDLQDKWKLIGMVPKSEVNNLWQNYHFYVEKFFDKVKINKELRDLDLKKNFESKMELCEKAEELLLETSILKSFKQLQLYHRQWKEIGPVPQDKKDDLWERFKSTTEKINESRREHYNKLRDAQKNNLVSKTALCEKAEELLQLENNSIKEWQDNTDKISELLKVWKTIGPAPRAENDEIWDRFKTSLDTFFAGKKEYFQQIKDEQLNNFNLKLDLCTQAEAIMSSTDWRQTTQDLINLQKEWKKIGPVPRKHSDKIWKRFRTACDEFFNKKSDYFSNIKKHESDNLKQKEELIKKVEAFEFSGEKTDNLEILKGFQREWSEIGHVPFKDKDKVQNTFRNVINAQLDKLKISKAEMQTINYKQRFENIKENPNARRIVSNEKHFLSQKVKKLEDEIQLLENNMGFLAQSKKADLLKLEFTKKIEGARTEVEVIKEKIRFLDRETD